MAFSSRLCKSAMNNCARRSFSTVTSSQRAANRCCLVTGATSGIGYEVTKQLALEGATHIRILSRDIARGENAIKQIKSEISNVDFLTEVLQYDALDSVNAPSTKRMFQPTPTWPHVDTMILCHGIAQSSLMLSTPMDKISTIIESNQSSFIHLSTEFSRSYHQYCLKLLKKSKTGSENKTHTPPSFSLISTSSLAAIKGAYGAAAYASTKAAILAFNRALLLEVSQTHRRYTTHGAPPFRINTILPGYINTPMTQGMHNDGTTQLEQSIPLSRFGRPEEVADAVLFLIGNEYANNCSLNLDGGYSAT